MAREPANILLVDDHPAKLLSYEVILQDLGARLFKASSAREALEILLKHDIAVVLTDVCMPELDGFELAKMLREHPRYESTAVIFISAVHLSEEDRGRGYELGAVDYVSVPVVPQILRAKVRIFVDLYLKTRELERLNLELEQRVRSRTAELELTNERLRESEERLRLASEAADFGTYDYDIAADTIYCSPNLKRLLGSSIKGEMSLSTFLTHVHPEFRPLVTQAMQNTSEVPDRHEIEFRSAGAGAGRWLLDRGRSFRTGPEGATVRTMGTILDISRRKQLEDRQKLLTAELDHRVKNVLANVAAMARLSCRQANSVESFVDALQGRLKSMARAHELLSQSNWISADLMELSEAVLSPFRVSSGDNIVISGDRLQLRPNAAQDLALVLHELATNAVKYGALSRPGGKVHLTFRHDSSGDSEIVWRESGGPPVSPPKRRGLGLTIIETALAKSGRKVECRFEVDGLVCSIRGSLSDMAPPPVNARLQSKAKRKLPEVWQGFASPPMRVLIVEDEPLLGMEMQDDLEQRGYTILGPVKDLAQAVEVAERGEFDLALLDYSMGQGTTAKVAEVLIARGIPFAFASGSDGRMLPDHLRAYPRLPKPYAADELTRVIGELAGEG